MNRLSIIALLFVSCVATAQTRVTSVAFQPNVGVGISNKAGVMFGAPFTLSGTLAITFNERWRIAAEGGALAFRDAKHPNDKIGLILSGYSRFDHQYIGLVVGHTLLKADRPQKLFFSSGADYLLVIDPNVKQSSGFLSGKSYNYLYKRYLNVPIQLDYSTLLAKRRQARLVLTGRWNVNAYHSFPTLTAGINLPIYSPM